MDKLSYKEFKILSNFLEEFSWISKKYKDLNIDKLLYNIEKSEIKNNNEIKNDKDRLIGRLPSFLLDRDIFRKNKDLCDFSEAIGIKLKFPEKRSRDEIIGTIICSIQENMSDLHVEKVCNLIFKITNNERILERIKFEKLIFDEDYDWNEAIKQIFG